MDRFLLFSYPEYYPNGGMRDLEFKFNNFSELVENKDDLYLSDYIEIYDIEKDETYWYEKYRYDDTDDIFNEFMADVLK